MCIGKPNIILNRNNFVPQVMDQIYYHFVRHNLTVSGHIQSVFNEYWCSIVKCIAYSY